MTDASGNPLEGVRVEALALLSHWVCTDSQGRYRLEDLRAQRTVVYVDGGSRGWMSAVITPTAESEWSPILSPGATLGGKVVDDTGSPIPKLTVRVGSPRRPRVVA